MKSESDADLFTYMEFMDSDPVVANAALAELMQRYQAIIHRRCAYLCSKFPALMDADELTAMTFHRACVRAETYKPSADPSTNNKYTAAWLLRIATNLLYDQGRNVNRERPFESVISNPQAMSDDDMVINLTDDSPSRFNKNDRIILISALNTLNEKQRMVLLWTFDKRQHSPTGARYMNRFSMKELACQLETTEQNVRQIRKRALDKIETFVKNSKQTVRPKA